MSRIDPPSSTAHRGLIIALLALVFGASAEAIAQDGDGGDADDTVSDEERVLVDPSEAQLALNKLAVEATRENKPEKALDLFVASLALGDLNVTWLNLGRLHATEGRCVAARDAYERARASPAVIKPSPREIDAILDRYETELIAEQCASQVRFICSPANLAIFLDGVEMVCPDQPVTLPWGEHELIWVASGFDRPLRETLQVEPAARHEVELDARPVDRTTGLEVAGWTLLGVGVGATGIGLAIDFAASDTATNEYVSLGLYLGGGALLVTGGGLLIADAVAAPLRDSPMRMRLDGEELGPGPPLPDESTSWGLSPWIAAESGGAALTVIY